MQESLTNCLRHAWAAKAEVRVRYERDRIGITVADDGRGADLSREPVGRGITGMRERAALLGGHLSVSSLPGAGFRVEASLPLETLAVAERPDVALGHPTRAGGCRPPASSASRATACGAHRT
ncbi:ATP-binding protein [Nonomuraea angiospora]|uniref:ATP-binding protein n=1 Tax=Nonomuraea angiospora TaxID=46172 RepID=UPI0036105C58